MPDTSVRGMGLRSDAKLVPTKCKTCSNVGRVWSDTWRWVCPYCGTQHFGVEKWDLADKNEWYRQQRIHESVISLNAMQRIWWPLGRKYPEKEADFEERKAMIRLLPKVIREKVPDVK